MKASKPKSRFDRRREAALQPRKQRRQGRTIAGQLIGLASAWYILPAAIVGFAICAVTCRM